MSFIYWALHKSRQSIFKLVIKVFLLLLLIQTGQAAEEARLMERWLVSDPLSTRTINHTLWSEILVKYVKQNADGRNIFNYAAVVEEDKKKIEAYISHLENTDIDRFNTQEQMAFWVNAFNALSVNFILEEYPVKSINDIGGTLFSSGPWNDRVFQVYKINLSLNDIYHRILRPIWQDSRVHYVLACTANSCPDILSHPYRGANIEDELENAAHRFVNSGQAILDTRQGGVRVSSIYSWYKDDFGEADENIILHLRKFSDSKQLQLLDEIKRISGHEFDWSLNKSETDRP